MHMDRTGRVYVSLSPREAQLLADNLPEEQLKEEAYDADSLRNRLENAGGGNQAPRDTVGINTGVSSFNSRSVDYADSGQANPNDYKHGYAAGR
jgi:hypothetical protein